MPAPAAKSQKALKARGVSSKGQTGKIRLEKRAVIAAMAGSSLPSRRAIALTSYGEELRYGARARKADVACGVVEGLPVPWLGRRDPWRSCITHFWQRGPSSAGFGLYPAMP